MALPDISPMPSALPPLPGCTRCPSCRRSEYCEWGSSALPAGGVAFHVSDLDRDERRVIEDALPGAGQHDPGHCGDNHAGPRCQHARRNGRDAGTATASERTRIPALPGGRVQEHRRTGRAVRPDGAGTGHRPGIRTRPTPTASGRSTSTALRRISTLRCSTRPPTCTPWS